MMAARTSGPLCFWCSTGASDAYRRALAARGANAVPVFNLDFYGLVHEPGGVAEHWDWIYRLALEYQNALRQVVGRWPGQPVRVLHHTLSWEHASALSIAIQLLGDTGAQLDHRSEEHTSELQSLMRNSYAVFCLKKKTQTNNT